MLAKDQEPYDGQILGIDSDGCLIQWDADAKESYNCGETPEEFGLDNITDDEMSIVQAYWEKQTKEYIES